ncbi:hypothetical protein QCA50_018323 [Cerrena zonata]|uniref:MYND-type domain-containing protein n=1 Tax=Cerrena zonata TaxID=2478898 RepID=A0AAW0FDU0_9APHY
MPSRRICFACTSVCKGGKKLYECSRCCAVSYCSEECQIQMWATHRVFCKRWPLELELQPLESLALWGRSLTWLKKTRPVLSRYAIWSLDLARLGVGITSRTYIYIQLVSKCTCLTPTYHTRCGFDVDVYKTRVRALSPECRGQFLPQYEGRPSILVVVDFNNLDNNGRILAHVTHQFRFVLPARIPPSLQDRKLSKTLQMHWVDRLHYRLGHEGALQPVIRY